MTPVLIASFHRSGSSLVAQMFHGAGMHLGNELLGAKPSNPYGHFEDTEVVGFHDALLMQDNHCWYGDRGPVSVVHPHQQDWIANYVMRKRVNHSVFGVKDPRFCLTMRHWQAVLGRVRVIFIHRDARQSCTSLWTRAVEDYKAGRSVELNQHIIRNPSLVARIYLHNMASFMSWRDSYPHSQEDIISVRYDDIVSGGRNIIAESCERWDLDLRTIDIKDYYDIEAVTANKSKPITIGDSGLDSMLENTNATLERLCSK